jgi:cytochrome bd ubiquinol oxidase subunit II
VPILRGERLHERWAPPLRRAFRRRGGVAALAATVLAAVSFTFTARYARGLEQGLLHNPLARCCEVATGIALILTCFALYSDRARLSRVMAGACVGCITIGWAAAQYPYLARPERMIFNSAVSESVLRDLVFASAAGAVVLFPSLGLLLYVFKDNRQGKPATSSMLSKP